MRCSNCPKQATHIGRAFGAETGVMDQPKPFWWCPDCAPTDNQDVIDLREWDKPVTDGFFIVEDLSVRI